MRTNARIALLLAVLAATSVACGSGENTNGSGDTGAGNNGSIGPTTVGTGGSSTGAGGAGGMGPGSGGGGATTPGNYSIDDSVGDWQQQSLRTKVLFAPHDDLEGQVLTELGRATSKIRLAFFNIRLDDVKNLLVAKKNAGVDVHVLLDKKTQDLSYNTMGADLAAAGVQVTLIENTSATNSTMHNKFAIVDDALVMTGSANYSYTALNVSDEDLITVDSSALAQRYQTEFDELVAQGNAPSASYPANTAIQAWMGPEDSIWSKAKDAIDGAQSTALLAMFELNVSSLVSALIDAHNRGVTVVTVLDQVQADEAGATADETLAGAGITVIKAHNTGGQAAEMHSKFLVVDHHTVVMGSYNWSNLGSYYNDENIVVLADDQLADRVEGKFAQLLKDYNAPNPGSLGLVIGAQPVTFTVGNVTMDPGLELTIQSVGNGPFTQPTPLSNGSLTQNVAAGTRLEYRYAIRSQNGTLVQELAEHSFTVPYASGPFTVSDSFQKP